MSKAKLPEIAPCPFCGLAPERFKGLGIHAVGCLSQECGVNPCAAADEDKNTPARAAEKWNRRADAEAERRGAMAAVKWLLGARWSSAADALEGALEGGEVLRGNAKGKP
jgi:hypothetical protein